MNKDKILELFNIEDYSGIKTLIENSDITEKQNIFNALSAVELVASELAYYDGIIAKYGESAPRDNMLQSKRVKLEELRSLIEKIDFE